MLTLHLMRHGHATGQGATAPLLPEGRRAVVALGRRLMREGLTLDAAFASPLLRAQQTARLMLEELACDVPLQTLRELLPDAGVPDAIMTLDAHAPRDGRILVVTHMTFVAHLATALAGGGVDVGFAPATLAEIELPERFSDAGRLKRVLHPDDD